MKHSTEHCTWCQKTNGNLTMDHLFPRSIGGTREVSLPACAGCQLSLSKAERALARSSPYAVYSLEPGPKGRSTSNPLSGVIQAKYVLVKRPDGGYGECLLRAGYELPSVLPHIEIDPVSATRARRRGASPADVEKLIESVRALLARGSNESALLRDIPVRTDRLGEVGADPDFWPRIVLGPSGKPFIRARDFAEATRFVSTLVKLLEAGALPDYRKWESSEIAAGTPHEVLFQYRAVPIMRVIAKIALGLAILRSGEPDDWNHHLARMRSFIIGEAEEWGPSAIKLLHAPGTLTQWPDHHAAFVGPLLGALIAVVSLYGDCSIVKFDLPLSAAENFSPIVARCRRDGTETVIVEGDSAEEFIEALAGHASQAMGSV